MGHILHPYNQTVSDKHKIHSPSAGNYELYVHLMHFLLQSVYNQLVCIERCSLTDIFHVEMVPMKATLLCISSGL